MREPTDWTLYKTNYIEEMSITDKVKIWRVYNRESKIVEYKMRIKSEQFPIVRNIYESALSQVGIGKFHQYIQKLYLDSNYKEHEILEETWF